MLVLSKLCRKDYGGIVTSESSPPEQIEGIYIDVLDSFLTSPKCSNSLAKQIIELMFV